MFTCSAFLDSIRSSAGKSGRYTREQLKKEKKDEARQSGIEKKRTKGSKKHTTPGIRWSSPTQLLVWPSLAYLWESGRDPEFSSGYGRMYCAEA